MTALIEAEDLRKSFGPITAVDGISLNVKQGEVLGFLGPNGAGKSTTMKMITGFLEPDAGTARLAGIDVQDDPKGAKQRLGYLPEGAPAYGEMTARDFLQFIAEIRGFVGTDTRARVTAAVGRAGLASVLDQRIETLSKGYKRRVGIAQAILHDPDILVMDEPTDGLDPNQKHHVRELIREMAEHKAIIVSTHILEEVEAVCTRAVVINEGQIVADGTAEDLMQRVPYHGAIAVRVPASKAETAVKTLRNHNAVLRVETIEKSDGSSLLRAIPKNGSLTTSSVTQQLAEKNLPFEEIFRERGKLDDVFRQITTGPKS